MHTITRRLIVASATLALLVLAAGALGQENRSIEKQTETLKQELSDIDTTPKPGNEVVALRDTVLKVGAETVANVRKGDTLTGERVQGKWLWVEWSVTACTAGSTVVLQWPARSSNGTRGCPT